MVGKAKWKLLELKYHIPGGTAEIIDPIKDLRNTGMKIPTTFLFNSPIWPVHKIDGSWRKIMGYIGDDNCSCYIRCGFIA